MRPCLNQPNKTDGQKEREMGKREGNRMEGGRGRWTHRPVTAGRSEGLGRGSQEAAGLGKVAEPQLSAWKRVVSSLLGGARQLSGEEGNRCSAWALSRP